MNIGLAAVNVFCFLKVLEIIENDETTVLCFGVPVFPKGSDNHDGPMAEHMSTMRRHAAFQI